MFTKRFGNTKGSSLHLRHQITPPMETQPLKYKLSVDGMRQATARKIAKYAFRDSLVNMYINEEDLKFYIILNEDAENEVIEDFLQHWQNNWKIYKIKKSPDGPDNIHSIKLKYMGEPGTETKGVNLNMIKNY